ncbi:endonuclease/exonuclease/phosphatase family protein [Nocardioides sp. zg-536]|uniref:Endonuclease/exonuclease/phosphatase family protein n=1 Tax=Nocardioides faecalis TaxID=2803858 RepID=A0A938Y5L2_9ACTN|nr:endonuclease/exonuclease/phosphatase family protein [Nocardioides faecalis]MBM9458678.1 endonuclease/exonuclease/phosphatase family protein [Nocardioides faecalis]QVI58671.1 endonuclease/exonuclease/phosphatase family protein [Nocardioides faecalis]
MRHFPLSTTRVAGRLIAALLAVGALLGLGAAEAAAGDAGPAAAPPAPTFTFTHGTHNVLHGSARLTGFADVIGWQELDSRAAQQRLRVLMGYRSYIPMGGGGAVSISWKASRFELVAQGSVLTHKGRRGVSPNRYVNHVILQERVTGKRVAFVNTHFINGAWDAGRFPNQSWRQKKWRHHYRILKDQVAALQRLDGGRMPVFVGGDMNRRHRVRLGTDMPPGLRRGEISVDQLQHTTDRVQLLAHRVGATEGSDHAQQVATYRVL